MKIKRGSTSVRRLIFVGDSTSTTGAGLTGLVYNSAGLTAYYFAGDLADEVVISLVDATLGTFTSGGFKQVDATNMPGWYEIGVPNAALDGGNEVAISLKGATNMVPVNIYIELDAFDYQTATQPVNVTQVGGDTQSATDLKDFADAGYDPATNKVQGVVLTDTVTTLTNLPAITANWLTAAGIDADAVTEIQAGLSTLTQANIRTAVGMASANLDTQIGLLATAANLLIVSDGVGFLTAVLMGACSDAGTAGETYVITFGGATYTADYTGLDVTGNRTTTTRTKT